MGCIQHVLETGNRNHILKTKNRDKKTIQLIMYHIIMFIICCNIYFFNVSRVLHISFNNASQTLDHRIWNCFQFWVAKKNQIIIKSKNFQKRPFVGNIRMWNTILIRNQKLFVTQDVLCNPPYSMITSSQGQESRNKKIRRETTEHQSEVIKTPKIRGGGVINLY